MDRAWSRLFSDRRSGEPLATNTYMRTVPSEATATGSNASGPAVVVETWLLRCLQGRWQTTSPSVRTLTDGVHPHTIALQVATQHGVRAGVVHSTSWRMVGGELVVTYIVVTPDDLGGGASDVHRDRSHDFAGTSADHTTGATDPRDPPDAITDWEVVHHALHHLALLATTDGSIRAALRPNALRALHPLAPAAAGVFRKAAPARFAEGVVVPMKPPDSVRA